MTRPILHVQNVTKRFGDKLLLDRITFDIRAGEKIGLVGWNGAGKTTLMKIIVGAVEADSGIISTSPPSLRIGYLPQSTDNRIPLQQHQSVAAEEWEPLLKTMSELGMSHLNDVLGESPTRLSGGERLKISLAAIWARQPQLLLLDEPTNHLDSDGLHWLIDEVTRFSGSALIISHDRYFLDQVVQSIYEIEDGRLHIYRGNYQEYRHQKRAALEKQHQDYTNQQRKVREIEKQIATLRQWSTKAHREAGKGRSPSENKQIGFKEYGRVKAKKMDNQIKSKQRRLENELSKYRVSKPKQDPTVSFTFPSNTPHGKRILEAKQLTKSFGGRTLFQQSNFYMKHGEKIALIGPNGAGKTTFINMILGNETVTDGSLWTSEALRIAYLSQDVDDVPLEQHVLDYVGITDRNILTDVRTTLVNIGVPREKVHQPLQMLSLGERTRVKLVKLLFAQYDMLILDEPTNHLDLPSREQLEETLQQFTGTLLVVSHDRYFTQKVTDTVFAFEQNMIKRLERSTAEYYDRTKRQDGNHRLNHSATQRIEAESIQHFQERLAVLDTQISELMGKISVVDPQSAEYKQLDAKLNECFNEKKQLRSHFENDTRNNREHR